MRKTSKHIAYLYDLEETQNERSKKTQQKLKTENSNNNRFSMLDLFSNHWIHNINQISYKRQLNIIIQFFFDIWSFHTYYGKLKLYKDWNLLALPLIFKHI